MAQLHGKVPVSCGRTPRTCSQSAMLGTLKYLSADIMAGLLARATPLTPALPPRPTCPMRWYFWPWWDTCEPDVVIEDKTGPLRHRGQALLRFRPGDRSRRPPAPSRVGRWPSSGHGARQRSLANHCDQPCDDSRRCELRRQLAQAEADPSRVWWLRLDRHRAPPARPRLDNPNDPAEDFSTSWPAWGSPPSMALVRWSAGLVAFLCGPSLGEPPFRDYSRPHRAEFQAGYQPRQESRSIQHLVSPEHRVRRERELFVPALPWPAAGSTKEHKSGDSSRRDLREPRRGPPSHARRSSHLPGERLCPHAPARIRNDSAWLGSHQTGRVHHHRQWSAGGWPASIGP